MKYTGIAGQQNSVFAATGMASGMSSQLMASAANFYADAFPRPPHFYDNDSMNRKLQAAKEWLKSREKK